MTWPWSTFVQILLWLKSNKNYTFQMYVCSLRYLGSNAHAPYFHPWPATSAIFLHIISKRHDFRKKEFLNTKSMFWFSPYQPSEMWYKMCTHRSSCNVPAIISDFNKTWIFSTDFRKNSNIKFHGTPAIGGRDVPCWRTDGQIEKTKIIAAFCSFANASKYI